MTPIRGLRSFSPIRKSLPLCSAGEASHPSSIRFAGRAPMLQRVGNKLAAAFALSGAGGFAGYLFSSVGFFAVQPALNAAGINIPTGFAITTIVIASLTGLIGGAVAGYRMQD